MVQASRAPNQDLLQLAAEIRTAKYQAGGDLYHPLPFPEFASLKSSSSARAAEAKWQLMLGALGGEIRPGIKVLDVGANVGYYAFSFAKLGAEVDAYEPHDYCVANGRRIADITRLRVTWFEQGLEVGDVAGKQYDVALLLSVFQWISRGNERLAYARDVLRAVADHSRTVFFELGCNQGNSAVRVDQSPVLWLRELLRRTAAPKRVAWLGTTSPWGSRRHMFVCTDDVVRLSPWQMAVNTALGAAQALRRVDPARQLGHGTSQ